jgi:hypothetical protein
MSTAITPIAPACAPVPPAPVDPELWERAWEARGAPGADTLDPGHH